jgi:hypothetical protein
LCISRTVVVGSPASRLVEALLRVCSFFIRCSELFEKVESLTSEAPTGAPSVVDVSLSVANAISFSNYLSCIFFLF